MEVKLKEKKDPEDRLEFSDETKKNILESEKQIKEGKMVSFEKIK